jgi:undecaprenyl-diphosphatase
MLEKILEYERELFFMLNGNHSTFTDHVMWLYSGKWVWLPAAFLVLIVLTYKVKWREWVMILLAIALVIALCDQFSSHICKPLFMRLRPTHHPGFMEQVQVVFGYRGGKYGFISGHAANTFGFATFMVCLFRRTPFFTCTLFTWATVMAYTRIYLGVHFISDVVPGILTGILFGYAVYAVYVKIRPEVIKWGGGEAPPLPGIYSLTRQRLIAGGIIVTVLLIIILHDGLIKTGA